jgi:hypothetical protein
VGSVHAALDAATFDGRPITEQQAQSLVSQAQNLFDEAHALATGS